MINLTRLNGASFALNDRLVERIEANPDTVIILVDGKKFIVAEPVDDVVEQIRQARADVARRSAMVEVVEAPAPELRLVTADDADTGGGPVDDSATALHPAASDDADTHHLFDADPDQSSPKEDATWTP